MLGGTGDIMKVMGGGGGGIPPSYNHEESMLEGSGEIIRIQGGGADSGGLQLELYTPTMPKDLQATHTLYIQNIQRDAATESWKKQFQKLLTFYKKRYDEKWWRYDSAGTKQPASVLKSVDCEKKDIATLSGSKLVEVLPEKTKTIIMIPPIKGDLRAFLETIEYIKENNLLTVDSEHRLILQENTVAVFMAPFFNLDEKTLNISQKPLLNMFMQIYFDNPSALFVLQDSDARATKVGCKLYDGIGSEKERGRDFLPNFLNPSFLLYPHKIGENYDGILITSEKTIMKSSNSKFKISEKLFGQGAFAVNPSSEEDSLFGGYLTFTSQGAPSEIPAGDKDVAACETIDTILKDIKSPFKPTIPKKVYILRLDVSKDAQPLICTTKKGALVGLPPENGPFRSSEGESSFHKNAQISPILFNGIEYSLRNPENPATVKNWEEGIFSKDESDFLNTLNLSPILLSQIYGDAWSSKLVGFLKNVVISHCSDSVSIISNSACEVTRDFVKNILKFFYTHDVSGKIAVVEEAVEEEKTNIMLPPSDSTLVPVEISWPEELKEITADDFTKTGFKSIEMITGGEESENYIVDLIVVSRKSGDFKLMRFSFPKLLAAELAEKRKKETVEVLADSLGNLKTKYTDFAFVY